MRLTIFHEDEVLAHILNKKGYALDLRCGGQGTCGRCGVRLISGEWSVKGERISVPADVLACNARLLGDSGEIEIPESSLLIHHGKIAQDWSAHPLPENNDKVIAVDIGTSTIAAVKIEHGKIIASASCYNSQSRYGDNVITRINHASLGKLRELQSTAVESLNLLLAELEVDDVKRVAVAGNSVMTCIFHGIDPSPIGSMPFAPPQKIFPARNAREVGLHIDATLLTVPCIAGYIGGDITSGIVECGLKTGAMLVDIGTNCEIVFHTPDGVFCTAAAAGPAFEGAGIGCGYRAVDGAIDHYFAAGEFSVLGGVTAKGLCGSAMIDFLAVERATGRLNEFGRIEPHAEFVELAPGVRLYECDIEQLLKAKAAVWAGIRTLEEHCALEPEVIYIAGGFGRYLDIKNAVAVGMLPERKYELVGNTSLAGAARLACTPETEKELEKLIDIPCEIQLNTLPGFEDNFIDGLLLP